MARRDFGRYFLNSTVVAVTVTASTLFFASLAGFGLAKYDFLGRNVIFVGILSTLMIPFQVIMIPVFLLVRDLGWLDTYTGLIVPQAMTAFGVFLVRQYVITLPDSLLDAAGSMELVSRGYFSGLSCRYVNQSYRCLRFLPSAPAGTLYFGL